MRQPLLFVWHLENVDYNIHMSNLLDYLTWRGDISLEQDPFNSIDGMILSCLSYVRFEKVLPSKGKEKMTIKQASEKFFKLHSEEELAKDKSFINFAPSMLKALAEADRFKDAYLSNYINEIDVSRQIQFSAVTIDTSDGMTFISYRGTDDSIIGWKEDFNLSFETVPAETEAAKYLQKAMEGKLNRVRIGGHSKGGHLAIYAAAAVPTSLALRIEKIYNFDGPGFNTEAMKSNKFKKIRPRIEKYIPETSIIGRLLENSTKPTVVKSSEIGIMQHNPLSWQLEGKNFVTCAATDKVSNLFDDTMTGWLDNMSFEERKVFVDELFSVFEASGCIYLSQLTKVGIKGTRAMIVRLGQIKNDTGAKVKALVKMFFINLNVLKGGGDTDKLASGMLSLDSGSEK